MSEILSQAEIEALLSSLPSSSEPLGTQSEGVPLGSRTRKTIACDVYDFRRPDKFSRDQLRALQMVHDTFARLCSTNLSAYLRTPIHIELVSLEQIPFEEYIRSLSASVFMVFNTPPLVGQSVLEMEFPLIFTLVDKLLGGPGRSIHRSSLTEIERPLVTALADRVLMGFRGAWESIVPLEPHVERLESSAQFVQIAPPNDVVITVLLEARVGDQRGAMSLCIPHMVIKPITPKLSSQKWMVSSGKRSSPQARQMMSHQLSQVRLPCTVQLGKAKVRVQQLMEMKAGDIFILGTPSTGKASVLVRGREKFRGRPGVQNRKLVIAITDVVSEE